MNRRRLTGTGPLAGERRFDAARCLFAPLLLLSCRADDPQSQGPAPQLLRTPDWRRYQAEDVPQAITISGTGTITHASDRFLFADLKTERDSDLAYRLLGETGRRIAFVDRHPERWQYYLNGQQAIESVDLYTHPSALGSQYGLCGVEQYSISFEDDGRIASVAMEKRYGVEGPFLQKSNFDWDYYNKRMCAAASAAHARSYFPAPNELVAQTAAELLANVIEVSASSIEQLSFDIHCNPKGKQDQCVQRLRSYLASLRFRDIDEFSYLGCPIKPMRPNEQCFTIKTGVSRLGPFPKHITVRGITYLHADRIDSVSIEESFSMS